MKKLFENAEKAKRSKNVQQMSIMNIYKIVKNSNMFEKPSTLTKKPKWFKSSPKASLPNKLLKGNTNGKKTETYLINLQQGRKHHTKLLNHVKNNIKNDENNKKNKAARTIQKAFKSAKQTRTKKKSKKIT